MVASCPIDALAGAYDEDFLVCPCRIRWRENRSDTADATLAGDSRKKMGGPEFRATLDLVKRHFVPAYGK